MLDRKEELRCLLPAWGENFRAFSGTEQAVRLVLCYYPVASTEGSHKIPGNYQHAQYLETISLVFGVPRVLFLFTNT